MKPKILILTPVFKDWQNLKMLLIKINMIFTKKIKQKFDLLVVDDDSRQKINYKKFKFSKINKLKIIKLSNNLGSQRAIAIGLKFIQKIYIKNYNVIIIDSDGQDNPSGILKLLKKNNITKSPLAVRRGQRKEPWWFKIFYELYCLTVFIFSLKRIRHGNYSLLSFSCVNKILKDDGIWSAFPPTLSNNFENLSFITIDREKRYSGNSKMNFFGLFYHALRVFSVLKFRILIFSIIYLIGLYIFLIEKYILVFFFLAIFLFLFNLINFILSLNSKKNYLKNYKKIKVYGF